MGMAVGKKSGGLSSEINVTPLADVMLVLLIIVMLIAPLLQKGVNVTLPEATNTADKPDNDAQTVLHVDAGGVFYVDNIPTEQNQLLPAIQRALDRKFERIVLIKADEGARYSEVMEVLDQLQRAGIEDIGLITERKLRGGAAGG
jgi:biopolymer transport protein TolR